MIQISTDSTCDLGEYVEKRDIAIKPLAVILGENTYQDGIDINPQMIFDYVEKTKVLPKTAAPSISEYEEYFQKYVDEGKTVIHYNISAKSSSSNSYAVSAAKKFKDKVYVVDSKALSSGQGLMVLRAADLRDAGKTVTEIYEDSLAIAPKINTSFVPDRLDYLYKGGRCSRMSLYGANLLRIHPLIDMVDGQLVAKDKLRGSMQKCILSYIKGLAERYPEYDDTRAFVTHSSADRSLVELAIETVKNTFRFKEVIETVAGSVITGHCGRNTLGVLFITK